MVGIIVTGHGTYATGLTSGVTLLAGRTDNYEAVDFLPEDSIENLECKLRTAVGRMSKCDSILIFADLVGGSPFNVSLRLMLSGEWKMEVVGGCNLPVVLDAYLSRMTEENVTELASSSVQAGRDQLLLYVQKSEEGDYEE